MTGALGLRDAYDQQGLEYASMRLAAWTVKKDFVEFCIEQQVWNLFNVVSVCSGCRERLCQNGNSALSTDCEMALRDPFPNSPNVSFGLATRSGKPATTLGGVGVLNMDLVGTIVASSDGTLSEIAYVHLCRMATVIASDCAFIMMRARRKLHLRSRTVTQA